jgi:hypothetical protein
MRMVRMFVGALGVAGAAYGVIELLDLGLDNLRAAGIWLVAGVVLHDGVLAPLTIAVCVLVARIARGRVPAPVVVGAVVLGTVTLVAVPVLGRFGARADNPTLLDRDYVVGWLVLAALTLVGVATTMMLGGSARRSTRGGDHGQSAGRR